MKKNKKKINYDKNISNDNKFNKIQKRSRLEVLSILLQIGNYRKCLEKSFYYHLFDSQNEDILYFLLEANRRFLYRKPYKANSGFITDENLKDFGTGKGVLNNISIFVTDTMAYKKMDNTALLDTTTIEFETYSEAFVYFSDMGNKG